MKKALLCILLMLANIAVFAQTNLCPEWAKQTPKVPDDANYFYTVGIGEGWTREEATKNAWRDALKKSLQKLGLAQIPQQDIDIASQKGVKAIIKFSQDLKRADVCVSSCIPDSKGKLIVYTLLKTQKSVHDKDDFFNNDNIVCNDKEFERKRNAYIYGDYPFSARVFVPGMAQLYKGSIGKGIFFIVGEIAFVGGIVVAESMKAYYKMQINSTHNTTLKQHYINDVNLCNTLSYAAIGGAVAIYVWNVIDGIVAKGKRHTSICYVSPYFTPEAGGLAMSIKF